MERLEEIEMLTDCGGPEDCTEGPPAAELSDNSPSIGEGIPEPKQVDPIHEVQAANIKPFADSEAERVRRIARLARAKVANNNKATHVPVSISPEPDTEPDGRSAAEDLPARREGKPLEDLAARIIVAVTNLCNAINDAVTRKLGLGELLVEAKGQCKAHNVDWSEFLASCELKERTAREAMLFHKNRGKIEKERHGGAVLTVTAVREALSRPRAKGGPAGPPDPAAGSSPTGDSASPRALPPPAPEGGEHGETSPRPGARVDLDDDRVVAAAEGPATTPGVVEEEGEGQPPPPVLGDVQAATDDRPSDLEAAEEACEAIMRILAEQIARVESGEADQAIEALRRAAPMILQGFQWLDEALRARGEATE